MHTLNPGVFGVVDFTHGGGEHLLPRGAHLPAALVLREQVRLGDREHLLRGGQQRRRVLEPVRRALGLQLQLSRIELKHLMRREEFQYTIEITSAKKKEYVVDFLVIPLVRGRRPCSRALLVLWHGTSSGKKSSYPVVACSDSNARQRQLSQPSKSKFKNKNKTYIDKVDIKYSFIHLENAGVCYFLPSLHSSDLFPPKNNKDKKL